MDLNSPDKTPNRDNAGDNSALYRSLAQQFMSTTQKQYNMRPLRRQVRNALQTLKLACRKSSSARITDSDSGYREWLNDNYYLLVREGANVINGLKHADNQPGDGRIPATCALLRELVHKTGVPDAEEFDRLIEIIQQVRPLTVFELEQLPLCLRAALVLTAAEACKKNESDAERLISLSVHGLHRAVGLDFASLTQRHSIVERILRDDPAGIYPRMDQKSRADYRRRTALEALRSGRSEASTAAAFIEQAKKNSTEREQHVGFPLMAIKDKTDHRFRGRVLLLCTMLIPAAVAIYLGILVQAPLIALLLYLPLIELFRPVIQQILLNRITPRRLPRIELDGIIPEEGRTVIAVSTLLPGAQQAAKTAEKLYNLYNTNGQGAVQVCLLADLSQADYPTKPRDAADISAMRREIRRLNSRTNGSFIFAVRPRAYSRTMKAYTGKERKRGAISELIRVIRGGKPQYLAFEGDLSRLRRTRFLLALDADTGMLLDTAADLVGTALHPLVKSQLSDDKRSIISGFGVLVPRLSAELHSANRTAFSRAMAGVGGITPYDMPVGDLYMDLFSSAIFAGKGLIDIEAFGVIDSANFPSEQILSHDILEGCLMRTGLVSDVEMTDGYPASITSWLNRLHRWVRGDWQNMPFAFGRRLNLSRLDRWKLIDNLRRSLTPPAALTLIILSTQFRGWTGILLALTGLISPISGNLMTAFLSLVHGGWMTLGCKYYSRVMPRALSALTQAWFTIIMLPATALTTLGAALRAVARLITRRRMLEWTTAAQSDKHQGGFAASFRRLWPTLIISAFLIYYGTDFARLGGILFALLIPLAVYSRRLSAPFRTASLSHEQKEQIESYASAMWRYYEEQCTVDNNYLPPDNVQESPVWRVAHRTSPTNIGLFLLSVAAAHDFGFLDTEGMLTRIEHTLTTIEKMEKWNGNLLNWYDTRTLKPLSPRYVSTVDSGNLACCFVALRQSLAEIDGPRAKAVAARAKKLQQATDLTPMFDKDRLLFHIGLDPDSGKLSTSYYDLLMSESRMSGYYAIAMRDVPKKHWGALGRTLTKSGNAIGPVSWTGSMFEYFMPRLMLPSVEGTMSYEALRFCLNCQRKRPPRGVPWGISESGFYAFDSNLNYQYKAHGVPRLALKHGLGAELVISPYSSFLTLSTDHGSSLRNLARLERIGMTGAWGFYEAADFTQGRTARGGYSIVRSYMAHHIGMSLISCANAVMDDLFVKRFLRDDDMSRAVELCHEKAPSAGTVFEPIRENNVPEVPGRTRPMTEEIRHINPRTPRMYLLSGAEWQLAITDTGAGISTSHGLDIHRYSEDLLRNPQGVFAVVDAGEGAFSITEAPDYAKPSTEQSGRQNKQKRKSAIGTTKRYAEFDTGAAIFTAEHGHIEAGMRAMVHPRLPCEQRQVVLKNHSNRRMSATVLLYFEPTLARREDALAHPAFSRIFLSARKDDAMQALFISRRQRLGEPPACLAAGLLDSREFEYEPHRELLLERPLGVTSIIGAVNKPFSSRGQGIPDCAVAIRVPIELPAHSQKSITLVLTAAPTMAAAANRLIEVRREGMLSNDVSALSPFGGVEAELAAQILPDLFYPPRISREWATAARNNTHGLQELWKLGISGDFPLLLIEIHNAADASRAEPYMRLHRSLRLGGVIAEVAIAYREGGEYDAPVLEALREAARNANCVDVLGKRGGIHPVNLITHGEQTLDFLAAVCAHNCARDLKRAGILPADYSAAAILKAEPVNRHEKTSEDIAIKGGLFSDDKFIITDVPSLPWCHVIANEKFGTLVSDKALGFTWAINSRENKLTPWINDTASDNRGEMLLVRVGGTIYDTVWGSTPEYGDGYARYDGKCGMLNTSVTVRIPSTGLWKTVELSVRNTGDEPMEIQAAYYTEPVLGVNRRNARHTVAQWENGALVLRNPFATVHGSAILTAVGGADNCDCDRGSFLSGSWGGGTLSPLPDPCASVIIRKKLPPKQNETITFVLGFAEEQNTAQNKNLIAQFIENSVKTPALSMQFPRIRTPDKLLNTMVSRWIPWQAAICRIYARTGFYQNGGAWGYRDQLQDSLATLWFDPSITRKQLIRCATVQFEEGDVFHWWYDLPGMFQGVRTRCSDDLVWLAYVTAEYVDFTGDKSVLDEQVEWLVGEPLAPEESEKYFKPEKSKYTSSLYEHCIRALDKASTHGEHGLPLIGSGDWNDGFNLIGAKGRGESVWLAMFLSIVLDKFAPICEYKGEENRAAEYRKLAAEYRSAADACFSGDRYLRAFFDDGTPLGAPDSGDGEIDSLPQSFSVLSGLPYERTSVALDTALDKLVDRENGVIKVLAPPFARSHAEERLDDRRQRPVGYITAYPPGLRENGGQYTHAAAWLVIALFKSGRADDAVDLLRIISTAHKYKDSLGEKYKGEPYALAGDVYSHPECPGRAGWTQYTGSAGWFYTAVLRHLIGLRPRSDKLYLSPNLPSEWNECQVSITLGNTPLEITIRRGSPELSVNGVPAGYVPLHGTPNKVIVTVPPPA